MENENNSLEIFEPEHYELDAETDEHDDDNDDTESGDNDHEDEQESEEQQNNDDLDHETVEIDGKEYKIPKELKDSFLRQADYTRKTQELSSMRRQAEASSQAAQIEQEIAPYKAHLSVIHSQVEAYKNLDWATFTRENPVEAQVAWQNYQQLKDSAHTIGEHIYQRQSELTAKQQQQQAEQLREGHSVLKRDIPNWSAEYGAELAQFGISLGFSREEMSSVYDPRLVKLLHAQYQAHKQVNGAKVKNEPKQVKPVKQIKAGASSVKDHSKMSTDQWMKHRNEQIMKKRGK